MSGWGVPATATSRLPLILMLLAGGRDLRKPARDDPGPAPFLPGVTDFSNFPDANALTDSFDSIFCYL